MPDSHSRLIVALDVPTLLEATDLARRLAPHVAGVKIGSQLFTAEGPRTVQEMRGLGVRVFLDLKFHDIPNTVAGAVQAATRLGVWMLNVHCSGGSAMLAAAKAAADGAGSASAGATGRPILLGVTVLTSLNEAGLRHICGTSRALPDQVVHLAREAQSAGLDGVVASPHEIADIRKSCGAGFVIVTPGVRPPEADRGDQQRVLTPGEAIRAGADYIVVGRPVLTAGDPVEAAHRITQDCLAAERNPRAESC